MREKITGESSLYLATNSPTPLLHPRNETHVSNHPRNLEKSMDHCRQDSRTFTVRKIGSAPSRGKQEIAWRLGAYLVAVAFTRGFKWHSLDRRFCHTIQPRKIFMGKNIFFAHRGTMQLFPRRNSNLSGNLSLETFFMKRNFLSAMFRPHLYFSCRQIRYGEVCCFSFFFFAPWLWKEIWEVWKNIFHFFSYLRRRFQEFLFRIIDRVQFGAE